MFQAGILAKGVLERGIPTHTQPGSGKGCVGIRVIKTYVDKLIVRVTFQGDPHI